LTPYSYYQDEAVTIWHGDCRETLPILGMVDHVITDPPYDAHTHSSARTSKGGSVHAQDIHFDPVGRELWFVPVLLSMSRRWVVAFCALEQLAHYQAAATVDNYIRSGVWRRHSGPQFSGDRPAQAAEGIAIMHRDGKKRWARGGDAGWWQALVVNGPERQHPTQKPEDLLRQLVSDFTDEGEVILDPFGGSGTTALAAKRLGRRCILIEKEEKYCEVAAQRLQQGALDLFGSAQSVPAVDGELELGRADHMRQGIDS